MAATTPIPDEVRDHVALRLAVEQATAGIGGLLEHWPCSPEHIEERLRDIYFTLDETRRELRQHRRVHDGRKGQRQRDKTPKPLSEAALIRQWAREEGYDVGERGRIPADVVAAYRLRRAA